MPKIKYTDEYIQSQALLYGSRSEFKKENELLYNVAWNRKLLESVCSHMKHKHIKWTKENISIEALKYKTRSEFYENNPKAYTACRRKKLLDELCVHMKDARKQHRNNSKIYKNRKTILYYIKIDGKYKIGVTLHEKYKEPSDSITKYRYNKYNNIEIISYKIFNNGEEAFLEEQKIIKEQKEYKYIGENFILNSKKSGGESECFTIDIIDIISSSFL